MASLTRSTGFRSLDGAAEEQGILPLDSASPTLAQALRSGLEPAPVVPVPSATLVPTSQELSRFQRLLEARDGLPAADRLVQAKALILCGLPYKRTSARSVDRQARTGARSSISVTFTAVNPAEPLPFGADRALLGWIQTLAYGSPSCQQHLCGS